MRAVLMAAVLGSALWLARAEEAVKAAPPSAEPAVASSEVTWETSFDKALQESVRRKVPVLADFSGSDWCGWCIKLDKEVFSEKAFKDYARENLVLFLADYPRSKPQSAQLEKQNQGLSERYGVSGFPTVLLLDATGKELARTGYKRGGAASYVEHVKELLQSK